ncbi:MAG: ABC transporter permease [Clostridia bacterium]
MIKTIVQRFLQMILVMFVVSILVFSMTYFIGNPVYLLLPQNASDAQIAQATHELGLDKPLPAQYMIYLGNILRGEFGKSYFYNQSALTVIMEKLPATLEIVVVTMLLTILVGIPLGVYAGAYPKRKINKVTMAGSVFGVSLPSFWIGMIMIYVFGIVLGWLPVSGRGELGTIFGMTTSLATLDGWRHIILPSLTLAMGNIATIIRLVRAGTQEQMTQDYVKFARSKGVGTRSVLFGHALKNTLIPVITIFGLQLGELIAFTTITETIFAWPGIGKMLLDAIRSLDRPIISAYLLLVAGMFIVINFLVDILYTLVDPRVDMGK